MNDVRAHMPLLEGALSDSGLDDEATVRLVEEAVCRPWSDYWVAHALNWIDAGVWSQQIADGLRAISQDKQFSQQTRHRAWHYVKPQEPTE